jgi:glycosyltransferase involved in cell wall biosynthesis
MSTMPEVADLVSTVITSFNKGPYLGEAIASALSQDYPSQEIIVVDDGSKDETASVCAAFGGRIQYIYQANQGCPAAKNTGILASRGEFVAILDGDDRWRPGKLTKQVALMRAHPQVGLVFTDRLKFRENTVGLPSNWMLHTPKRGWVLDDLLLDNFIAVSTVLARRQCLFQAGLFNPAQRIASDYDLWLRFARQFEVDYIDEVLMEYRLGIDSIGTREGSKFQHVMNIQNRFVRDFYQLIRRATANRVAAHGDQQLAAGKHWHALCAHANALRLDVRNPRRYWAIVRSLFPNSLATLLRPRRKPRTFIAAD